MKTFSIEMPRVEKCEVILCAYNAYNLKSGCHARAITIGHGRSASCNTFFEASPHNRRKEGAGVGACKVSACAYNNDYECEADAVVIEMRDNEARCMTFAPA